MQALCIKALGVATVAVVLKNTIVLLKIYSSVLKSATVVLKIWIVSSPCLAE